MSDFPNDVKDKLRNRLKDGFDETDDELLALAPARSGMGMVIFVSAIIVLSLVMAGWFLPELRYFLCVFEGPVPLGEAADVPLKELKPNRYVSIEGMPLMNKTLAFNEGVKWFPQSDTTRKFFPLAGQQNMFVQWEVPDEHKAFRDPAVNPVAPSPPSYFEGRLMRRDQMGKNFEKIWLYYDCLKLHPLRRCNYCLGRSTSDACRNAFTCREWNTPERCGEILARSLEPLSREIAELEDKSLKNEGERQQNLSELKELELELREQRIAVASVKLGELTQRSDKLAQDGLNSEARTTLSQLRLDLLTKRLKEFEIRTASAKEKIESLEEDDQQQLKSSLERLHALREKEKEQVFYLTTIKKYVEVGTELDKFAKRAEELIKKVPGMSDEELNSFGDFLPDSTSADGKEILKATARLEQLFAEAKRGKKISTSKDGGVDESGDAGVPREEKVDHAPRAKENKPTVPKDPRRQKIIETLRAVKERAKLLQKKIAVLKIDSDKQFKKWATRPDVLGGVPEGLMAEYVIGSMAKLEQMLADVDPAAQDASDLGQTLQKNIDILHETRGQIEQIQAKPGVAELEVIEPLEALEKRLTSDGSEQIDSLETEFAAILQLAIDKEIYRTEFRFIPEQLEVAEKLLKVSEIENLEKRLKSLARGHEFTDWVIVDGETPGNKAWILIVYGVLALMTVANVRKFLRLIRLLKR